VQRTWFQLRAVEEEAQKFGPGSLEFGDRPLLSGMPRRHHQRIHPDLLIRPASHHSA
jgi:hypothetical protein